MVGRNFRFRNGVAKPGKFEVLVSGRILISALRITSFNLGWDFNLPCPTAKRSRFSETNQPLVTQVCSSTNGRTDVIFPNHKTKEEIPKLANFYHFFSPSIIGGWKMIVSSWVPITFQGRTVKLRVCKSKKK